MKGVTPGNPPTLQLLRNLDSERQTNQAAPIRPKLKLVDGTRVDKPRMPPSTSGVQIQISEEGRALVARLAQKTEHEYMEEPSDVTISRLVAEGIEEGFWE